LAHRLAVIGSHSLQHCLLRTQKEKELIEFGKQIDDAISQPEGDSPVARWKRKALVVQRMGQDVNSRRPFNRAWK
jgi:hypothetical protein